MGNNYCYDFGTNNLSFLRMKDYLRRNKINNNKFMLILYNKSLKNVDPYDPNLTLNQKIDIVKECYNNIWYYLRSIAKIPLMGSGYRFFNLDKANCAQVYCTTKYINSWLSKPRQLCKSIDSLVIVNYMRIFHGYEGYYRIRLCAKDLKDSKYMEEKLKSLTDLLPPYIQTIASLNSKSICSDTPKVKNLLQAENLGRSFTESFFHFQDAEYIPYILDIYGAMLPVYKQNYDRCKEKGIYSSILFESVFADDHPDIEEFLNTISKWDDSMYDYSDEQFKELLKNKPNIIHIYTTYQDLGLGEEYFKKQSKLLNDDFSTIRREVLLKRKSEIEDEELI